MKRIVVSNVVILFINLNSHVNKTRYDFFTVLLSIHWSIHGTTQAQTT